MYEINISQFMYSEMCNKRAKLQWLRTYTHTCSCGLISPCPLCCPRLLLSGEQYDFHPDRETSVRWRAGSSERTHPLWRVDRPDTIQISTVRQLVLKWMSGSWPCIIHSLDSRVLGRVDKFFWVILILSHFPTVGSKKGKELILQLELGSAQLQTVLGSHLANRAGRMCAGSPPLRIGHQVCYLSSVNAS